MRRRWAAALFTTVVVASGCTGGGEDGSASDTVGSASASAVEGTTSITGEATAEPAGTAEPSRPPTPGGVTCTLVEGGTFVEFDYTNDSDQMVLIRLPVRYLAGTAEIGTEVMGLLYIQPGESVRTRTIASSFDSGPPTACEVVEPAFAPASLYSGIDLGSCNYQPDAATGSDDFDVELTNNSERLAISYEVVVGLYNEDGVRVATDIFIPFDTDGERISLDPGASMVHSSRFANNSGGVRCEVIGAVRSTPGDFLAIRDGVTAGSLDADIAFASGSAGLTDDAMAILQVPIAEIALTWTGPICIEGYADSVGADADNLTLSQQRAEAVAEHMLASGLDGYDIQTVGYGEAAAGADEVDDPTLRRVDISLAPCP